LFASCNSVSAEPKSRADTQDTNSQSLATLDTRVLLEFGLKSMKNEGAALKKNLLRMLKSVDRKQLETGYFKKLVGLVLREALSSDNHEVLNEALQLVVHLQIMSKSVQEGFVKLLGISGSSTATLADLEVLAKALSIITMFAKSEATETEIMR
jgi:hypothetical protein